MSDVYRGALVDFSKACLYANLAWASITKKVKKASKCKMIDIYNFTSSDPLSCNWLSYIFFAMSRSIVPVA